MIDAISDLTQGQMIVIALRLVIPLMILWRPLSGSIIAMLLDAFDVVIVEFFGPGGMGDHYQNIDKLLDLYYFALHELCWPGSYGCRCQPVRRRASAGR